MHTPTPWEVKPEEVNRPYIRIRGTRLGQRYKIANVLTPVYDGVLPREADETRANAALIVQACNSFDEAKNLANRAREVNLRCLQNDGFVQYVEMQELVDLADAFFSKAQP